MRVVTPDKRGGVADEFDVGRERRAEAAEREPERGVQRRRRGGRDDGGRWGERESVGAVGVGELGRTDAVGADDGDGAGEGFGKSVGVAEAGVEETVLADERAHGGDVQVEGGDRRGRVERFEMRVQGAEEEIGGGGRCGQAEGAGVRGLVGEGEREGEFLGDEAGGG